MTGDDDRDPSRVASCLSDAMQRAVLALPSDGAWLYRYHATPNTVRVLIWRWGLIDTEWVDGAGHYAFRLNSIGRHVRALLDPPRPAGEGGGR